jgi:hypothetical protein
MTSLAAVFAVALAAGLAPAPAGAPPAAGHQQKPETRCDACHTAEGWDRVAFDHARTGFALEGQHRTAACGGCHAASDFKRAVPRACVACHRDAHAGRMGTRCADCHDAVSWKESTLGPEAHRRTDFPLDGRHAVLPCEECHGDRRDRSFSRSTRRCADCHQADLARAATVAFDHVAAFGNADECRRCHGTWRFSPGYLPGHDACFPIRSGTHSGIRCLRCHTRIDTAMFVGGACGAASGTLNCYGCHGCPDGHAGVGGFSCPSPNFSQDCYQCHFVVGVGGG